MSGFKDAQWSFAFAASQLGDWFCSAGFPVESVECPEINGKAEPMPHAYFAFVDMPSEEAAQNAKNKLNMTKLDGLTILIDFRLEDRPIADPAAVKQVCVTHLTVRTVWCS